MNLSHECFALLADGEEFLHTLILLAFASHLLCCILLVHSIVVHCNCRLCLAEYRLQIVNSTANVQIAKRIAFNFNLLKAISHWTIGLPIVLHAWEKREQGNRDDLPACLHPNPRALSHSAICSHAQNDFFSFGCGGKLRHFHSIISAT